MSAKNKKRWSFPAGPKYHILEKISPDSDVWIISEVNETEIINGKEHVKILTPIMTVKERALFDSYPDARKIYEKNRRVRIIVEDRKE